MDDEETAGGPAPATTEAFSAELARWRGLRRLSKKRLAAQMGFDPSYVSHIEGGRHRPSEDFARRADSVLDAGGALWRLWQEYQSTRWSSSGGFAARDSSPPGRVVAAGTDLVVELDEARLTYVSGVYRATHRRRLYNAGSDPITRYLIRISVDRFPGEPERSNRLYRERPLTWFELGLVASFDGEEMAWKAKNDRDSLKEVWLLFENAGSRFPLYPGERAVIEYSYRVSEDKWGFWFQRAIRLPTQHVSVRLDFPAALKPAVWGTETSMTAESFPFRTAIARSEEGERAVFDWGTDDPPLNARYRVEWRFRDQEPHPPAAGIATMTAGERMRAVGVVQHDDPILRDTARPYQLPAEAGDVRNVLDLLFATMQRAADAHVFGKGMGLAAPQIGTASSVAVVQPPEIEAEAVILVNPRVIAESSVSDEQYEGCLSFFDTRGLVSRPLWLQVEHTTLEGRRVVSTFERSLARLVAHEIDHLYGHLYTDKMPPGAEPIPVTEYDGTGRTWAH